MLLTPASLQLAQLQAQLTLHRLKLAQSGNTAAAATVLNQVLSNVAMSQPLFNQLRGSSMPQAPGTGFPSAPIPFPPPPNPLGTLAGGAFTQNHAGIRTNHYGGGGNISQTVNPHGECGNKASKFQAGFLGGTTVGASKAGEGGQYGSTGPKSDSQNNYQRDFYSSECQIRESSRTEQWKNPTCFPVSGAGSSFGGVAWAPSSRGFAGPRAELYNPEEPTGDPKFSPAGGFSFSAASGQQGFVGYPQQQKSEEGAGMTLQTHQLNDYHGVTPSHLPHQCTICEKKVYNLKVSDTVDGSVGVSRG